MNLKDLDNAARKEIARLRKKLDTQKRIIDAKEQIIAHQEEVNELYISKISTLTKQYEELMIDLQTFINENLVQGLVSSSKKVRDYARRQKELERKHPS